MMQYKIGNSGYPQFHKQLILLRKILVAEGRSGQDQHQGVLDLMVAEDRYVSSPHQRIGKNLLGGALVAEDRYVSSPHQRIGKNLLGGALVAEVRSGHSSRTEAVDIIDLGTWQEAVVRAIDAYRAQEPP